MTPEIERRIFEFEVRKDENTEERKIIGHAAVFGKETDLGWGMRERVSPGAFDKTIKVDDIRALFNHNSDLVLARSRPGKPSTLRLYEDEKGLAVEIDPPDTTLARDLIVLMERGDISQMSFGFNTIKEEWTSFDDYDLRDLKEVKLWDVSPVTYPAYPQTDVAVRSHDQFKKEIESVDNKGQGTPISIKRNRLNLKTKEV